MTAFYCISVVQLLYNGGYMKEPRLKNLRERTKMTAYAFSKKYGFERNHYYMLERGDRGPNEQTLIRLSQALGEELGMKPSDVMGELTGVNEPTLEAIS